jgi:peptidoglycan hydrolase-like protein with peptidoglycan-binding domain
LRRHSKAASQGDKMPNKERKKTAGSRKRASQAALKFPSHVGLKLGAKGQAVRDLHEYLGRFGYLHVEEAGRYANIRLPSPRATQGHFDEATVEALRAYQKFHGLAETGVLDQATIGLMSMRRCGFPDIVQAAAGDDFVVIGKWPKKSLKWAIANFSPDLPQNTITSAMTSALGLWSAAAPLSFTKVQFGQLEDILIAFVAGVHGCGPTAAFDGVGGVLAHAYGPFVLKGKGDAHFDEAESWSVSLPTPAGKLDLISVAAHEFGHSLGLGHSSQPGTLMFPIFAGPHRFLSTDDSAGIKFLYG